jgi:hypothetical protein
MTKPRYADPTAAETAFYAAFAAIDFELMDQVWASGLEPLCVHPGGGLLQGRQAIMQSWMEIFSGAEPPRIEHRLIGRFESGDIAVHLVEELIQPKRRANRPPNRVLATNIYVREAGSWRMVEHHASLPLVERDSTDTDNRQLH